MNSRQLIELGEGELARCRSNSDPHAPPRVAHRSRDRLPPGNVLLRVDAGRKEVTLPVIAGLHAFRDDEPHRRPLGVVVGVHCGRRAGRGGPIARHGRHRESMLELDVS
jgi:hypothetical protein